MTRAPRQSAETKICKTCKVEKPAVSFYVHRTTKDRRASDCSECEKARRKAYVKANSERIREYNATRLTTEQQRRRKRGEMRRWWLKQYGLTPESYEELLASQGSVCAICQLPERGVDSRTGEPRRLSVDHDHATYRVRGLLCIRCNQAIGQFADDPARLHRAIDYLDRNVEQSA